MNPFRISRLVKTDVLLACVLCAIAALAHGQDPAPPTRAQVVMLGTGTPNADPERSGPSVAIVVNGSTYLVDAGPGVVRRAAAAQGKGMPALAPPNLKVVFLTHLHSDHTLGLPDMLFTPWTLGRTEPLRVFGPPGTVKMMRSIEQAWAEDVSMRLHGGEPANRTGYRASPVEIKAGVIYQDTNVTVTAFPVSHGSWKSAFGYRFDTFIINESGRKPDRSIVISGDTTYAPTVAEACHGCDVLLHEVYSQTGLEKRTPEWRAYHARFHTSSGDVARIATAAKPSVLVLYHQLFMGTPESELVQEVQRGYAGKVISAKDLDVF